MIYLDYTANTPADPDVLDAYLAAERRYIANPNSTHIAGQEARAEMERVTQSIAQHLGVQPAEIIYTSGASEANNLALKGIAHASRHIGKHIISTQLEHSSVGAMASTPHFSAWAGSRCRQQQPLPSPLGEGGPAGPKPLISQRSGPLTASLTSPPPVSALPPAYRSPAVLPSASGSAHCSRRCGPHQGGRPAAGGQRGA